MDDSKPYDVGAVDDFASGCVVQVFAGDSAVALYNLDGSLFATSDACTHGSGSLSEGSICGEEIECAMHMGRFAIRTGKATGAPCVVDLRTFRVQIQAGRVLLHGGGTAT
ncbi:MAG: non-heme iron oxygenase ferredoxin subunit [Burkholderiaceae bacterium]